MAGDPGQAALDGRSNGAVTLYTAAGAPIVIQDGQVLPWRPVKLYRPVKDSRDRSAARNSGSLGAAGLGGPPAGTMWDTPSTLDQVTVLSEDATKVYVDPQGKDWTLHDMVLELFKDLQKRQAGAA
jgi:hypothetical protein